MKKQITTCLLILLGFAGSAWAQGRTVTGNITSEDGEELPGVNVLIQGTTQGTVTDLDGNYSISVPADASNLVYSFVGFQSQVIAIGNRSVIDIQLAEDIAALEEVVVTALGIERTTEALNYSVTEVDGASFVEAREINVANALAGKVAGVNVSNISTGPQGSTRVIIRGNTSLGGNNQPLYVVDGVPLDNTSFGQAGLWGGFDEGDGMSSINPDDIETMTVLKGANAAALYGSRASNGVILITTKSGKSRKGVGVEFRSNYTFEKIINHFDLQQEYGHGRDGSRPTSPEEAFDFGNGNNWGTRLDGSMVPQFDGISRPYIYQMDDNIDRYYETGSTFTNTIGLTGGNDDHNIRVNLSSLQNDHVLPNSGFDRYNASLSYNGKFGKLTLTSKVLYSYEDSNNRPRLTDSPGNGHQGLLTLPLNYNVNDLIGNPQMPGTVPSLEDQAAQGIIIQDGKAPGEEFQISNNLWNVNPWFAAYQFDNDTKRDRMIVSQLARFDITDFLYVQGRFSMDYFSRRRTVITPTGTGYARLGNMNEEQRTQREVNLEGIIGYQDQFGDLSINAFVGGNRMRNTGERLTLGGSNFNIPFFYTFSNLQNQSPSYGIQEEGINSVFFSAEVGWKDFLYVTATGRQDWFSTLNPDDNSIFYPSIGGSFIFTELLGNSGILSYGKLRASWAQVGGDTNPYNLLLTYNLGQGHLGQPNANIAQGSIPNAGLTPLTSEEIEVGFDLRFFDGRLGMDFTYYDQTTTDDILSATISQSSGFGSTVINIGEINNNGVELLLTGTPIRNNNFSWDVSLNMAWNDSEVVQLNEGLDEIRVAGGLGEPRSRQAFVFHVVGEPFGTIKGFTQEMIDGQPVFNPDNGQPVRSSGTSILGNGVHKYTGGITNTFNWKNWYGDFLIDFKSGGKIYSGTNVRMTQQGVHRQTVQPTSGLGFVSEGRESLTVTGVTPEGNPMTMTLDETQTDGFWGAYGNLSDRFMRDASFAKLRQVSIGYRFPSSLLDNTPIQSASLSFVGRNLAVLFDDIENVDAESTYNNSNAQGLDYYALPQTRSYGFNLVVTF
jgi:TonB-linked SusC/RagA family outer membrane protein